MGARHVKPTNGTMVDRLVRRYSYIRSYRVEGAFRAVDRAMYLERKDNPRKDPYGEDQPWREDDGPNPHLHLSAPCIYAKVVEALDLEPGQSFINMGSGTGYLNTIVGLLIGPNGINHGIEIHKDMVEYANKKLQLFKQESSALDKYDFSEPSFVQGNCLSLNPKSRYDRIYLGAACLPELEEFMKNLIKSDGGILVMPCEGQLMRITRISETSWTSEKLMDVNYTEMVPRRGDEPVIDMPLVECKSLKNLCRLAIRQHLRNHTNLMVPELLNSDNVENRRQRAIREQLERRKRRAVGMRPKERGSSSGNLGNFVNSNQPSSLHSSSLSEDPRLPHPQRSHLWRRLVPLTPRSPTFQPPPAGGPSSSQSGRMMTRSASRKMSSNQSTSSRPVGGSTLGRDFAYGGSSSSSSDSDSDHCDNPDTCSLLAQNCARTRPYVCSASNNRRASRITAPRVPITSHQPSSQQQVMSGRLFNLADSQQPSPSSSHSTRSANESRDDREYCEFIGRQVLLNWPIRFPDDDERLQIIGLDRPSSPSASSSSSSSSAISLASSSDSSSDSSSLSSSSSSFLDDPNELGADLDGLLLGDNHLDSFNESSWDGLFDSSLSGLEEDNDGTLSSVSFSSSDYRALCLLGDEQDEEAERTSGDDLNIRPSGRDSSHLRRAASSRIIVSLSGRNTTDDGAASTSAGHLAQEQPVASRLRSSEPTGSNVAAASWTRRSGRSCRHKSDCPAHQCRPVSSGHCRKQHQGRRTHQPGEAGERREQKKPRRTQSEAQSAAAGAAAASRQRSGDPGTSAANQRQQTSAGAQNSALFTGRVLITTGLGSSLSLAASSESRSDGRRRSVAITPSGDHLGAKRKRRHSSSGSSSPAGELSPTRRPPRERRRCARPPANQERLREQMAAELREVRRPSSEWEPPAWLLEHERRHQRFLSLFWSDRSGLAHQPAASRARHRACCLFGRRPCPLGGEREEPGARHRERRHQEPEQRQKRLRSGATRCRTRRQRPRSECDRYRAHLAACIRRLPIPSVLHSYLDYERGSWSHRPLTSPDR